MWINKIGNKSASFINHKHFHPGNIKNLERVWIAEENERKRKELEEKYLKKKEEQYKTYILKKQLRNNEKEENKNYLCNIMYDMNKESKTNSENNKSSTININKKNESNSNNKNENIKHILFIKSKYDENIFSKNHKSIYGSYYDKEKKTWGYKCCKNIDKNSFCANNIFDNIKINNGNKSIKKDLKKKKKKKKKIIIDNSITAVLNKIK